MSNPPLARCRVGCRASAGLAGLAGLAVLNALPSVTAIAGVRRPLTPRLAGLDPSGAVAVTFDDGPDPKSTPAFLDALAAAGARATFFLLGTMIERAPALTREIAEAGHEVAVHGWTHRCVLLQGPLRTADEITRTWELIGALTGLTPVHYRPPYGILSVRALQVARRLGMTPILWTTAGREWEPDASAATVWRNLRRDLRPGATVLLHDSDCTSPPGSWRAALAALPCLVEECAGRGLTLGTLAGRRR